MLRIEEAAALLKRGGTLIYPTETFFGIGCVCGNASALAAIYRAKRRAANMPLPIVAAEMEELFRLVVFTPPALRLAELFWPGPLSMLLPALAHVPLEISAGTGKLAVRITPHPAARALALSVGEAIFASSANISGRLPVTNPQDLDPELTINVGGIFNAPPAPAGGLPSTLVEIVDGNLLRLARAGAVSGESLREAGFELV